MICGEEIVRINSYVKLRVFKKRKEDLIERRKHGLHEINQYTANKNDNICETHYCPKCNLYYCDWEPMCPGCIRAKKIKSFILSGIAFLFPFVTYLVISHKYESEYDFYKMYIIKKQKRAAITGYIARITATIALLACC